MQAQPGAQPQNSPQQPAGSPVTIEACMTGIAEAFMITDNNCYWSETIDVILQDTYKDHLTNQAGIGLKFDWRQSYEIYGKIKAIDDAKTPQARVPKEAEARAYFTELFRHVNGGGNPLIVPINTGGHWTMAILKRSPTNGQVFLYYIDPLGQEMSPKHKDSFVAAGLPAANIIHSTVRLQNENPLVDCGPYMLKAAHLVAQALVDQNELSQAQLQEFTEQVGQQQVGERSATAIRLAHAQKIYELSRNNPLMKEAHAVIHGIGKRERETLKGYLKAGDFEQSLDSIARNRDWLFTEKTAADEICHRDPSGETIVTELGGTGEGQKSFTIADDANAVIRVPLLKADGSLYKINGEIQYDILMYEKGKLTGIFLGKCAGAHSQINPKWLAQEKSTKMEKASFIDGNKQKELKKTEAKKAEAKKTARPNIPPAEPSYPLFSALKRGFLMALGARPAQPVAREGSYPLFNLARLIILGGHNRILAPAFRGSIGVLGRLGRAGTQKVVSLGRGTLEFYNAHANRVRLGQWGRNVKNGVGAAAEMVKQWATGAVNSLVGYLTSARGRANQYEIARQGAIGVSQKRGGRAPAQNRHQFNNLFAQVGHVASLGLERLGCRRAANKHRRGNAQGRGHH